MNSIIESPVFEDQSLAACTPAELIDLMVEHEDRVPRKVIDECASRGDAMLDVLTWPTADLVNANPGHWWLCLHSVMILGLIPGERAGKRMLEFIRRIDHEGGLDLQDWLAGEWSALLHNKPHSLIAPLREICTDDEIGVYMRANITTVVIEHAQQQGEAELEQTLDWLAQLAANEDEDWEYRLLIAQNLMDFPRDRHRALLTDLADRQTGWSRHFDKQDVDRDYMNAIDTPEWERFRNPWRFYEPKEIKQRQQRWQEEERDYDIDPQAIDVMAREIGLYDHETYQRETPKIGRNDPCPCGSGKKYKKCCMGKG